MVTAFQYPSTPPSTICSRPLQTLWIGLFQRFTVALDKFQAEWYYKIFLRNLENLIMFLMNLWFQFDCSVIAWWVCRWFPADVPNFKKVKCGPISNFWSDCICCFHPSIIYTAYPPGVSGGLEPIPAAFGQRRGGILDRSSAHHQADTER